MSPELWRSLLYFKLGFCSFLGGFPINTYFGYPSLPHTANRKVVKRRCLEPAVGVPQNSCSNVTYQRTTFEMGKKGFRSMRTLIEKPRSARPADVLEKHLLCGPWLLHFSCDRERVCPSSVSITQDLAIACLLFRSLKNKIKCMGAVADSFTINSSSLQP